MHMTGITDHTWVTRARRQYRTIFSSRCHRAQTTMQHGATLRPIHQVQIWISLGSTQACGSRTLVDIVQSLLMYVGVKLTQTALTRWVPSQCQTNTEAMSALCSIRWLSSRFREIGVWLSILCVCYCYVYVIVFVLFVVCLTRQS